MLTKVAGVMMLALSLARCGAPAAGEAEVFDRSAVVVVDTETTSLRPDAQVWEVTFATWNGEWQYRTFQLPHDQWIHPAAAAVSHYSERWGTIPATDPAVFAAEFCAATFGKSWFGNVPSFDEPKLRRLVEAHGCRPGWHYQLHDVEDVAAGVLIGQGESLSFPTGTAGTWSVLGVGQGDHSSEGDVRASVALLEAAIA